MTCLQIAGIAGTVLQLIGVLVTGLGLLHAWNRASRWFDEWLDGVKRLRSRVILRADVAIEVTPRLEGHGELTVTARAADPENRLLNIEKRLDDLPGQIDTKIQAAEAAMDERLAELDASGKSFAVKDIYWALRGIGIQVLGYLVSLWIQLSS